MITVLSLGDNFVIPSDNSMAKVGSDEWWSSLVMGCKQYFHMFLASKEAYLILVNDIINAHIIYKQGGLFYRLL